MTEFEPKTDRRKIQTNKGTPSRQRWARSVIVQAVRDIVINNRKFVDFYDENWGDIRCVDHAMWFIHDKAVDMGSYSWYCSIVQIDPDIIRNAIRDGDWDLLMRISKIPFH